MFFFFNPEVINGKNVYYTCSKSYDHEKLPASVIENVELEFNGHGTIIDIKVKSDYILMMLIIIKNLEIKVTSINILVMVILISLMIILILINYFLQLILKKTSFTYR